MAAARPRLFGLQGAGCEWVTGMAGSSGPFGVRLLPSAIARPRIVEPGQGVGIGALPSLGPGTNQRVLEKAPPWECCAGPPLPFPAHGSTHAGYPNGSYDTRRAALVALSSLPWAPGRGLLSTAHLCRLPPRQLMAIPRSGAERLVLSFFGILP